MKVHDLVHEYEQQRDVYLQTKGQTLTEYVQSPKYAEGYAAGLARRLAGKKPVLSILAEHNVTPAEFMARVNARGGTLGAAVDAVLAEIEAA